LLTVCRVCVHLSLSRSRSLSLSLSLSRSRSLSLPVVTQIAPGASLIAFEFSAADDGCRSKNHGRRGASACAPGETKSVRMCTAWRALRCRRGGDASCSALRTETVACALPLHPNRAAVCLDCVHNRCLLHANVWHAAPRAEMCVAGRQHALPTSCYVAGSSVPSLPVSGSSPRIARLFCVQVVLSHACFPRAHASRCTCSVRRQCAICGCCCCCCGGVATRPFRLVATNAHCRCAAPS
jgi:hypothetical protein